MLLIAADYHPSFQQIAFFAEETSERGERQLNQSGAPKIMYANSASQSVPSFRQNANGDLSLDATLSISYGGDKDVIFYHEIHNLLQQRARNADRVAVVIDTMEG
jgi:hypothetical protein